MGKRPNEEPSLAPGDDRALEENATSKEVAKGDYTRVTELSYNEVWNTEDRQEDNNKD